MARHWTDDIEKQPVPLSEKFLEGAERAMERLIKMKQARFEHDDDDERDQRDDE